MGSNNNTFFVVWSSTVVLRINVLIISSIVLTHCHPRHEDGLFIFIPTLPTDYDNHTNDPTKKEKTSIEDLVTNVYV